MLEKVTGKETFILVLFSGVAIMVGIFMKLFPLDYFDKWLTFALPTYGAVSIARKGKEAYVEGQQAKALQPPTPEVKP